MSDFAEVVTPGNVPQDLGLSDRLRRAADEYDRICLEQGDLIDEDDRWLERWDTAVDQIEELLLDLLEEDAAE